MNTLPKGTQIKCPRKRHIVGVLTRALQDGEGLRVDRVTFEEGQSRIAGEPMKCRICDSVYFLQGRLYTEHGWWPSDPKLETATKR